MSVENNRKFMKIKVFTQTECKNPEIDYFIPLLFPFWGKGERKDMAGYDSDRYDEWTNVGSRYFQLVNNIKDCDIVVLPYEWRTGYKSAFDLADAAAKHAKPFVVFFNSDSIEKIPIDNAIIFRTSMYRSMRGKNEYGLPGWSSDLAKKYLDGRACPKDKNHVPVIGYTGYIDYRNPWEHFKFITRFVRRPAISQIGLQIRGNCVRNLLSSSLVKTIYNLRKGCQTGTSSLKERQEFVNSILNSDYSLVCRGGGNFSYRLHEVLSLGRIPLFIDTDCVLPYDHIIDWKRFCLWVDCKDVKKLGRIVVAFHDRLTNDEFKTMQKEARNIYEQWICPTGFYRNLWRCIPGLREE